MILDYPKIYKEKELIGQGGNQDWFANSWARKAGCASVSATDIFIYYTKREREFDKSTYLDYMNEMFKLMEPGKRGFPYVFLYARRFLLLTIRKVTPPNRTMGKRYAHNPIIPKQILLIAFPTIPPIPNALIIRIRQAANITRIKISV